MSSQISVHPLEVSVKIIRIGKEQCTGTLVSQFPDLDLSKDIDFGDCVTWGFIMLRPMYYPKPVKCFIVTYQKGIYKVFASKLEIERNHRYWDLFIEACRKSEQLFTLM